MDVALLLSGFGGFMVGLTIWPRVVRWLHSLWTVSTERRRNPAHRSAWRLVAVVLLHSGPWMLAVLIVMAVLILPSPHAAGWNVFFYGFLVGIGFMAVVAAWLVRKVMKKRAQLAAQSAEAKLGNAK